MLRVTLELGKEALDVCLRRNGRAPQALPGGSHQSGRRGAGHGHGRPEGCWSGPGREWLASLELPAASREVIGDGLALTGVL